MPKTNVKVTLIGQDGNGFGIISKVNRALKKAGFEDEAKTFMKEAMSGDYDHLLRTVIDYVEVE